VLRPLRGLALCLQQLLARFPLALWPSFFDPPWLPSVPVGAVQYAVDLSLGRNGPRKTQDNQHEGENSFHHARKTESPKLSCLFAPLLASVFHNVLSAASIVIRGSWS
jgi:hypothetical protein